MTKINVIGGGILGASTAFHLAVKGAEVTLIDSSYKGQATNAGAGIIGPWLSQRRNKDWYNMARGGAKFYPELISRLAEYDERNTGYKKVGSIHLHDLDERLEHKYNHAVKRKETAPEIGEISLLDEKETRAFFPQLREGYRSVHITGSARVDGRELKNALLQASVKLGVNIIHGEAELIKEKKEIIGATVNKKHTYYADKTVVTTGAWTKKLLEPLGYKCLVTPQKGQILHMKIEQENDSWPVVMPHSEYYLLHFGGGHVVFGASREDNSGYNTQASVGGQQEIINACLELAPGLKNAEIIETRVGLRPFTPGFLPIFGRIPDTVNGYIGDGLGASGLTAGPYLGRELASLALESETELNPDNYSVDNAVSVWNND
ncbi:NAD(P)/FAD-dependent oxidoreductase [Alkalicoccus daliensis]|uniref:D-amino-acid dehydrogenase n=1 Tax=Alkalicoccus daliensis TaxID=745820 RepID=A0A1H0ALM3_9BACI|nr:D-amino-acid dehydrogenase [Alkalicoccus daliensis]